jgi:hypothetical protein
MQIAFPVMDRFNLSFTLKNAENKRVHVIIDKLGLKTPPRDNFLKTSLLLLPLFNQIKIKK